MKLIIIINIVLLIQSVSFSQELQDVSSYYYKLYQGKQLLDKGNSDSACIVFEDAFEDVDFISTVIFKRTILLAAKKSKNKELITKYSKIIKSQKQCPSENKFILKIVDSLSKLDQKVRSNKIFKARQFYKNNKDDTLLNQSKKFLKAKELHDMHVSVDSSNIKCMLKLIEKYGYIGEQLIGYHNNYKARSILLHYDTDTNNRVLAPIFLNALLKNYITPYTYSLTLDRHLYATTSTQKYWMWFMIEGDPCLTEEEITNVIKMRESIGLWGTIYKVDKFNETYMLSFKTSLTL